MDTPPPARPRDPERIWRALFALLLAVAALVAARTFRDYGVTWDEEGYNNYGDMVLRWYTSRFQDRAALGFSNLYLYGGLHELYLQPLTKLLLRFKADYWEARHGLTMITAIVGLFATYRLGSLLGGARAGFLSALFLALTPVYLGHSAYNPKDLPFAVAFVIAVDGILRFGRSLPRPSAWRVVWTGIAVGLPLALRIGGVFVVGFLGLTWLGMLLLGWREGGEARPAWRSFLALPAILVLAWAVMVSAWPWAQQRPLVNPVLGFWENVHFKFASTTLYDGERVDVSKLPWTYLPRWFGMVLPEFHFAALLGGVAAALAWRRRAASRTVLSFALLAFFVLFPAVSAIVAHSTLYDGMRHFLFLVPMIAVLSGAGVSALLAAPGLRNWVRAAVLLPVAASCALTLADEVRLHPYQAQYFNRLVAGGVAKASKRFPTDYWRSSYREAIAWIAEKYRPELKTVKINICGPRFLADAYLPRPIARGRVEFGKDRADSHLLINNADDPCGLGAGKVVHSVERMRMPLSYVYELH